jgi:2-haloacid dehalogenase
MMTYKWLLFDMDDTLFDYDRAEESALRATFEQVGLAFDEDTLRVYRGINDQLWLDLEQGRVDAGRLKMLRFERLFAALEVDHDPPAFSARYLGNLGDCVFLIDGAEDIVRALGGSFNLGVITNGLTDVQRARLAKSGFDGYVKAVIISEEIGAAKPDAAIFDIAFERMGHPAKDEVLIVGDSLSSDIVGGLAYGIDTCWFNPAGEPDGHPASTYEIRRLSDLLPILGVD